MGAVSEYVDEMLCEREEYCEVERFVDPDDPDDPGSVYVHEPSPVSAGPTTGVYFVRGAGLVKIGLARCVLQRFRDLQVASPVILSPAGFIPTPDNYRHAFALERQLHTQFAHLRKHGEWFEEAPELTAYLESRLTAWPERRT